MRLSILVPCYNEKDLVLELLGWAAKALPGVEKEIILVDDGSTDGTRGVLEGAFGPQLGEGAKAKGKARLGVPLGKEATIAVIFHAKNGGKGAAIRTAMAHATGDVMIVQDADLEYDPGDYDQMWDLIVNRKVADVVYGSRFYGRPHRSLNYHHFLANRLSSFIFNVLYNQTLTDVEVCYKMITREVYRSLKLSQNDFGFEIQISSQIARRKTWRIYELGIRYYGRTYDAGKKINWKDGVKALGYLVWFRFAPSGAPVREDSKSA